MSEHPHTITTDGDVTISEWPSGSKMWEIHGAVEPIDSFVIDDWPSMMVEISGLALRGRARIRLDISPSQPAAGREPGTIWLDATVDQATELIDKLTRARDLVVAGASCPARSAEEATRQIVRSAAMAAAPRPDPVPYSIDLATNGIETVDVEIRSVIAAINRLPGVARTLFSCAGYGRAGLAPRNSADHPADDPTGHFAKGGGYVVVEFDRNADHDVIQRVCYALSTAFEYFSHCNATENQISLWRFAYYTKRIAAEPGVDRDACMRAEWDKVLAVVTDLLGEGVAA